MSHYYGDDDFSDDDFQAVDEAAGFIHDYCVKWARLGGQWKEKYGCYDDQTDVLTKSGWKLFKDVDIKSDQFATLNDSTGFLEYQEATEYFEKRYCGDMYQIVTRGVDLLVTPNHNLYVAKGDINGGINNKGRKTFPYHLQTYKPLFRERKKFIKGAKWEGLTPATIEVPSYRNTWKNSPYSTRVLEKPALSLSARPLLRLLGWFVAEGCYSHNSTSHLCLHKDEADELGLILNSLDIKYKKKLRPPHGCVLDIYDIQLHNFFLDSCGKLALNKHAPDFVKDLSPELIEEFLIGLFDGDGNKTQTANILTTISKQLADDVLELLLKAGYCGSLSSRDRTDYISEIKGRKVQSNYPVYEVNWLNKTEHHSINSHDPQERVNEKESLVSYRGKVYCVSVPNKILYVRRNGKPVWCGNTCRFYAQFGLSLHSLLYPGHYYYRFPKWVVTFDLYVFTPLCHKLRLSRLWGEWQKLVYIRAYKLAIQKYPRYRKEILAGADYSEWLTQL